MRQDLIVKEVENKNLWEEFVLFYQSSSFLQSWNWGETNRLMGDKIFRLGLFEDGKLAGVCLAIKTQAKRGPHLLIPGGPLISWQGKSHIEFLFDYLKQLGHKEKCWFIRVRPQLQANEENKKIFRNLGFSDAPMHLHAENTWVLDISKPEEEILAGMRKTTRYLIRQGEKIGLSCEKSQDPKEAKILFDLQKETVTRHSFVGFPQKLFEIQLETFGRDNQASLFLVRYQKKVLSVAIFIFYGGIAYYHHSGSSSVYPKIPASYFMLWQAIKEAKNRGCHHFNFWGIAPTDNPKHRFAGVTTFKKGFGGERFDHLHAQDFPLTPLYRITYLFETIRRIRRGL